MAPVQDVDFLPIEFRQQDARRQVQPWRIVVVVTFALMLTAAAFTQVRHRRYVEAELGAVQPYFEEAGRLKSRLTEFQAKLQTVESDAGLLTYLRCPWPRTQLLTVLLAPLPAEIGLYQIQVTTETPTEQPVAENRSQADRKADEEKLRKAPPSCRDLKRLREEFDKAQTLVRIAGTTRDTGALYPLSRRPGQDGPVRQGRSAIDREHGNPAGCLVAFSGGLGRSARLRTTRRTRREDGGPAGGHPVEDGNRKCQVRCRAAIGLVGPAPGLLLDPFPFHPAL